MSLELPKPELICNSFCTAVEDVHIHVLGLDTLLDGGDKSYSMFRHDYDEIDNPFALTHINAYLGSENSASFMLLAGRLVLRNSEDSVQVFEELMTELFDVEIENSKAIRSGTSLSQPLSDKNSIDFRLAQETNGESSSKTRVSKHPSEIYFNSGRVDLQEGFYYRNTVTPTQSLRATELFVFSYFNVIGALERAYQIDYQESALNPDKPIALTPKTGWYNSN